MGQLEPAKRVFRFIKQPHNLQVAVVELKFSHDLQILILLSNSSSVDITDSFMPIIFSLKSVKPRFKAEVLSMFDDSAGGSVEDLITSFFVSTLFFNLSKNFINKTPIKKD